MKLKCFAALIAAVFCLSTAQSAHEVYDVKTGDVTITLLDFEGVKAVPGTKISLTKAEDSDSKMEAVSDALGTCTVNLPNGRYILGVQGYDVAIVQASGDAKIEELQLFMPKEGLQVGGQEVVQYEEGVEVIQEEGVESGSSAKKKGILLLAAGVVAAILLTDDDDDSSSDSADATTDAVAAVASEGSSASASSGSSAAVRSSSSSSAASSSSPSATPARKVVTRTRARVVYSGGSGGSGGNGGDDGGGGGVSN